MAFVSSKHSEKISIYLGPLRLPPQAVRKQERIRPKRQKWTVMKVGVTVTEGKKCEGVKCVFCLQFVCLFFFPSTAMAAQWQYHVLINCSDLYNQVLPSSVSGVNSSMKNLSYFVFSDSVSGLDPVATPSYFKGISIECWSRQAIERGVCVRVCVWVWRMGIHSWQAIGQCLSLRYGQTRVCWGGKNRKRKRKGKFDRLEIKRGKND